MAVNPAQLAYQTQQAYSQGTDVDVSPLIDGAKEKRDYEREEYKSLQDVGSELDADFYGKWESNLNSLYDKAASGELKVGSPEWSAATKKLKDRAAQIKQVQDLRDEQIKLFQTKPDQTQFLEETESGELIDTGSAGYRERIEELLQNNYDDPTQLANDFAKLSRRVQVMPTGISAGFKEARVSTERVGETLLNAGETEIQNQQVRSGNITFDVKTTMNPADTDRMVKGLVSQYEHVLRADYKRKAAAGDMNMTENDYVKTTIESMLPSGKVETKVRSVPQPRNNSQNKSLSLRRSNSGSGYENDFYKFTPMDVSSTGEKEIKVTSLSSSEPNRNFIDDRGRAENAKLASLVLKDGKVLLKLAGEDINPMKPLLFPAELNLVTLQDAYGISEEDLMGIFSGELTGGATQTSTDTTPPKRKVSGVGAKYNKQ